MWSQLYCIVWKQRFILNIVKIQAIRGGMSGLVSVSYMCNCNQSPQNVLFPLIFVEITWFKYRPMFLHAYCMFSADCGQGRTQGGGALGARAPPLRRGGGPRAEG